MAMLLVLLATTALIWAWGLQKPARQWLVILSLAAWLACAWVTWPRLNAPEEPSRSVGSTWQSWSSLAVKDRLDQGQAVFVDFTAAWCVTCQLNKQTTLSHPDVLREFERQNISLMRADWTRRDPSITRALAELGRSGVPVYVLYKPGQAPLVLSELLSPTLVLNTLKQR
jgi:thiol:disulfide interchange protein DsbD